MKKVIIALSLLLVFTTSFSQVIEGQVSRDAISRQEQHYTKPTDIETTDLKIEFLEAVSQETFTMVKVKITNKTDDFILFDLSQTQFTNSQGTYNVAGKSLMIAPMSDETKTLTVKGTTGFNVSEFSMSLQGFSRIPTDIQTTKTQTRSTSTSNSNSNSQIAIKTKEFAVDSFHCSLLGITRKGNVLEGHYKCIYTGEKHGIIYPTNLVLVTVNGTEYANQTRIVKSRIMSNKSKENFTVVFAVPAQVTEQELESYSIDWKDMFTESDETSLSNSTFDLTLKTEDNVTK